MLVVIYLFIGMYNPNIPYTLLKEQIERQNRNSEFLHYTQFRTNVNKIPITTKFYSKYDSKIENLEKNEFYIEKVDKSMKGTVKTKYPEPVVESHL